MKTAYYDNITVTMRNDAVKDLTQPGDATDMVSEWIESIRIDGTPDAIRTHLAQYGAWDESELADDTMNRHRLAWLAAGDIADGMFQGEEDEE